MLKIENHLISGGYLLCGAIFLNSRQLFFLNKNLNTLQLYGVIQLLLRRLKRQLIVFNLGS